MDTLTNRIASFLLSDQNPNAGLDRCIDLVLSWVVSIADLEAAFAVLGPPAARINPKISGCSLEQFRAWTGPRRIQQVFSLVAEILMDKGSRSKELPPNETISGSSGQPYGKKDLVSEVKELPTLAAVNLFSDAIITWAWSLDESAIERDAKATGLFRDGWNHKDLVGYVFYSFYAVVVEGMFHAGFTYDLIDTWCHNKE